MEEKTLENVREEIEKLSEECSRAAKDAETLQRLLEQKNAEVSAGMEKLEKLYDFLDKQSTEAETVPVEKPLKQERKRGRPRVAPEERKKISAGEKKAYDRERYLKKKAETVKKKREKEETAEEETRREPIKPAMSIEEVNSKAREAGISYGKYLMRQQIIKQHDEMMASKAKRHADKNKEEKVG